jgi:transposase
MIDYETYCKIRDHRDRQGLTITQTARALGLHPETVSKWSRRERYEPRAPVKRGSQLDPYKGQIIRWLEAHPLSAQQVFQRLREDGYPGGLTIVNTYVRQIRPPKRKAFLKLNFASGECAQVDWGEYGSIAVGSTRRRLSFFVMVLCYSRQMYVEFTVSQTMEHFLGCHERAFAVLGVPTKIMVDNLKSAVLRRLTGTAPVFNPRYVDYARHHSFEIVACNVAAGNEKGRVESGVGYVKKNFLNGAEFTDFSAVNPAAQVWLNEIANVREHGETHQRPVDLFAEERGLLRASIAIRTLKIPIIPGPCSSSARAPASNGCCRSSWHSRARRRRITRGSWLGALTRAGMSARSSPWPKSTASMPVAGPSRMRSSSTPSPANTSRICSSRGRARNPNR